MVFSLMDPNCDPVFLHNFTAGGQTNGHMLGTSNKNVYNDEMWGPSAASASNYMCSTISTRKRKGSNEYEKSTLKHDKNSQDSSSRRIKIKKGRSFFSKPRFRCQYYPLVAINRLILG